MFVRPITRAAVCRHSMGGGVLNSTTTTMAASWLGHRLSLPTTASASSIGAATTSLGARWITSTSFILPDPTVHEGERRHVSNLQLTKIVATIGPTSEQAEPLRRVVDAGMRIMRLNFSHATKDEVELRMTNLALAQQSLSPTGAAERQDVCAILLDTKGPEIRSGKLQGDVSGHETVTITQGSKITLHTDLQFKEQGSTASDLYIDYASLHKAVKPGSKVLLDDGAITLTVEQVESHKDFHGKVVCIAENSGELRSRAGVNLPLADTSDLPAMSEKDKADILYGMSIDIDYVAASFVQNAQHVRDIRAHIKECATQLKWDASQPLPLIISKIESASALTHFDEILKESDGIMVARGDLGVEIPLQQVTNAQKEMVAACNSVGKPCIVATQMLESMSKNPRPTRAEVSDVTNAVYDGADAVMTSGESAKGKYPDITIKMMNEIILSAERYEKSGALGASSSKRFNFKCEEDTADADIALAAARAAQERGCAAIMVLTNHGTLPRLVAAFRPTVPILTIVPSSKIGRQLQLYRAIHPIVGLQGISTNKRPQHAIEEAKRMGFLKIGDEVVIVAMEDDLALGRTANLKIVTIQ